MKLSEWAKQQGVHYQTAYTWYKLGKLPVKSYQTDSGSIFIEPNKSYQLAEAILQCEKLLILLKNEG